VTYLFTPERPGGDCGCCATELVAAAFDVEPFIAFDVFEIGEMDQFTGAPGDDEPFLYFFREDLAYA
jgi:hypothetical protein